MMQRIDENEDYARGWNARLDFERDRQAMLNSMTSNGVAFMFTGGTIGLPVPLVTAIINMSGGHARPIMHELPTQIMIAVGVILFMYGVVRCWKDRDLPKRKFEEFTQKWKGRVPSHGLRLRVAEEGEE